jgi:LmbE family N-acetylglucosaminyl deacetylase
LTPDKIGGATMWLGLRGARSALADDVVVISPHLDDAVFSVGAAVAYASRRGVDVKVLTVLAGDPRSQSPAGDWDRVCGFDTAGEAARVRRTEDEHACELVGATPVWLPYGDEQYERGGTDDEIRSAVAEVVGSAGALVPGFPLTHRDHRWLHELLRDALGRVAFYTEQPYAAWAAIEPPAASARLRAGLRDRWAKTAASRCYATQLGPLGRVLGPTLRYELRAGGETAILNR